MLRLLVDPGLRLLDELCVHVASLCLRDPRRHGAGSVAFGIVAGILIALCVGLPVKANQLCVGVLVEATGLCKFVAKVTVGAARSVLLPRRSSTPAASSGFVVFVFADALVLAALVVPAVAAPVSPAAGFAMALAASQSSPLMAAVLGTGALATTVCLLALCGSCLGAKKSGGGSVNNVVFDAPDHGTGTTTTATATTATATTADTATAGGVPDAIEGVAVTVPDGPWFAKVRKQLSKVSAEVTGIAASWAAILGASGELPVGSEVLIVVWRAVADAASTLHTSVAELKRQLSESEQKMKSFNTPHREKHLASTKKQLAHREASLAATRTATTQLDPEGTAAAQLAGLSAEEVKGLPTLALAPEHVDAGDPSKPTLQRVVGALAIVVEAGDAAAVTAAKLAAAVEVHCGKRTAAAAESVPKILEDVERCAAVVSELMKAPGATEALAELKQLAARVDPGAEAAAAALVAGDPEAPAPTDPGHAFPLRRRAGAACAFLCSLVCAVVSGGSDGAALVIPGGIKAVPRMVFKTMVNCASDFSKCKDVVRVTIQVGSLAAVASTVELLFGVEGLKMIRIKDRFQLDCDSAPIGGHRDVQLLCVFKVPAGGSSGRSRSMSTSWSRSSSARAAGMRSSSSPARSRATSPRSTSSPTAWMPPPKMRSKLLGETAGASSSYDGKTSRPLQRLMASACTAWPLELQRGFIIIDVRQFRQDKTREKRKRYREATRVLSASHGG